MANTILSTEKVWTKLHEKYQSVDVLGQGTYGIVYKAVVLDGSKEDDEKKYVALKRTALDQNSLTHGMPDTALREMGLLKDLRHPNILKIMEFSCNLNRIYVVMELLDKDLKQYIRAMQKQKKSIPVVSVKHLMFKVLQGISYLHRSRVMHRDLKPHNILVSNDLEDVKLADFGLARATHCHMKTLTHEVITLWYRPPEILLGDCVYTRSVDIWSTGCILAELLLDGPLFDGENEFDTILKIFNHLGTPTEEEWPKNAMQTMECLPVFAKAKKGTFKDIYPRFNALGMESAHQAEDLILNMLQVDPTKRFSASDCINHPWFDDIRSLPKYECYWPYHHPADAPLKRRHSRYAPLEPPPPTTSEPLEILSMVGPRSRHRARLAALLRRFRVGGEDSDGVPVYVTDVSISQDELKHYAICMISGLSFEEAEAEVLQHKELLRRQARRSCSELQTPMPSVPGGNRREGGPSSPPLLPETPFLSTAYCQSSGHDKRGDRSDLTSPYSMTATPRLDSSMMVSAHDKDRHKMGQSRPSTLDSMGFPGMMTPSSIVSGSGLVASITRRLSREIESGVSAITRILYPGTPNPRNRSSTT